MKALPFLFLLGLSAAAQSHEVRHLEPHVHGQAALDVAIDQGLLTVLLQAPGIGILDFERPPATPQERARLATALSTLKSPGWLELPTAARCTLLSSDAKAEGFDDRIDHDERHADGQSHEDHRHAGFSAEQSYRCAAPAALTDMAVRLPSVFEGLQEVVVNTATEKGQGRAVVTQRNTRVRFGK